jgi:hypothetical protein
VNRIPLKSRYGDTRFLVEKKDGYWTFEGEVAYMRYMGKEGEVGIDAFDPDGGPYVGVGDIVVSADNKLYTVVEIVIIYNKLKVKLEATIDTSNQRTTA